MYSPTRRRDTSIATSRSLTPVSFRGEVRAELLDDLEVLKAQAQETGQPQVVVLGSQNVLVGRARFELAVSWSQTRRFTELSHRPTS
jgi:hypothetical protein